MKIEKVVVGTLETNSYIIANNMNEVLVIDPGAEFNKLKEVINNRKVIGILVTHEHFDHIGVLKKMLDYYSLGVNKYENINFTFEVIKTPGHSSDSKTFYFKEFNLMFTGDFLFNGTFGRVDLPGSSKEEMVKSLIKIKKYPEGIKLYPGHGDETLLSYEEIDSYINYFL